MNLMNSKLKQCVHSNSRHRHTHMYTRLLGENNILYTIRVVLSDTLGMEWNKRRSSNGDASSMILPFSRW